MKFAAIITAGGTSSRYGSKNKLLEKINGKEVIKYSTNVFLNHPKIDRVIICANESIISILENIFDKNSKLFIVKGGTTRQDSVYRGLKALKDVEYVLIHDGARPVIDNALIDRFLDEIADKKALTAAVKTTDTIKVVNDCKVIKTLERDKLYNIQTPQAFEYKLIKEAHEKFVGENFTDDAGMVEELGKDVFILENDYRNIKITTKYDLDIAKIYLNTL